MANAKENLQMNPIKRFVLAVPRQGGRTVPTRTRTRGAFLLPVLAALLLAPFIGSASRVEADDNLPIYTSPIDATGLRIQLQASVPDRDSGRLINTPLPVDQLPPKFKALLATPLSTQIDEYWNVKPDPRTGKTPRQQACDRIRQGLDDAVAKAGSGFSVYDFSCNLATRGTLLVKQEGPSLTFGYTLLDSSLEFYVTTPGTCNRNTSAPVCPNDPGLKVTMVPQLVTTLRTPELCGMTASDGTAVIQSPHLEPRGALNVAQFIDSAFFGGSYNSQAEQAIRQSMMDVPLPLDAALAELRGSPPCRDRSSPAGRVFAAFKDIETAIEPAQGAIILRASHPPIAAPRFLNAAVVVDSTPSFTRPSIAAPPLAAAGSTIKVTGQFFPQTADPTVLSLSLDRDATSACLGGATELEWGPSGGAMRTEKLSSDGLSCTGRHEAKNLTPATAYRFRARDCDALTCSPWSQPVTLTTAARTGPGAVTLTLDGASLGTATVGAQGTFDASVVIPTGTAAGNRTIRAVSGAATADTSLQVTASGGSGRASILLTGTFFGDRGCPTRALPDYAQAVQIDDAFSLYGTGFAPGAVTVHLDSATGLSLGTATAAADGTFCSGAFRGPSASQVGDNHTLVAVQNNTAQATIPVRIVRPSVVR
jgi:hypothetical protein